MSDDMSSPRITKKKTPQLTAMEQEFIIDIVDEFKGVLESKRNDIRSIEKKEKAWKEIEAKFCAMPNFIKRDHKQLKECWNNLKMKAKKCVAMEKRERKKTGGGIVKTMDSSNSSQKICTMIPAQMHPLQNDFDNDKDFHHDDFILPESGSPADKPSTSASSTVTSETFCPAKITIPSQKSSQVPASRRTSVTSTFASAKSDFVNMGREEHLLKMKLINTQIEAASKEHQAKMEIYSMQSTLLDLQISQLRNSVGGNTRPEEQAIFAPPPRVFFQM